MHRLTSFRYPLAAAALRCRTRVTQPHLLLASLSRHSSTPTPTTTTTSTSTTSQPSNNSTPTLATPPLSFIERAKRNGPAALLGPFRSSGGFDRLLDAMTVDRMDASGHAVCTLPLSVAGGQAVSFHNSWGKLHGGMHALLVDVVGTLALLAADCSRGGVSVDISCQYVDSVDVTDTLRCEGRVLKLGRRLGFTEVLLYRQSDGKLVASGRHIKAM